MGIDPCDTLRRNASEDSASEAGTDRGNREGDLISEWLFNAAIHGCVEILPDLQSHDPERYVTARERVLAVLGDEDVIEYDLSFLNKFPNGSIQPPTNSTAVHKVMEAARSGDLTQLQNSIHQTPELVNAQDEQGNTALVHAARCGRYGALQFLLQQPNVKASICNKGHQTALHFLSNFSDEEIRVLVPCLVRKHASISQEASPPVQPQGADIAPRIRSCPVMLSILWNNITLLIALLDAAHFLPHESQQHTTRSQCHICEAGSQYRRILAISISLHRADAIKVLLEHLELRNARIGTNLDNIEVWYDRELLPIWCLAIKTPSVSATDLPEPFFRALNYGESFVDALKGTLHLIWKYNPRPEFVPEAYKQFQEAVIAQNLDAIDFLMEEAKRRQLQPHTWWWILDQFHENPLLLSVRWGYRDVFQKIWRLNPKVFHTSIFSDCSLEECRDCRKEKIKGGHSVNIAQIALSLGAVAAHQDHFFV